MAKPQIGDTRGWNERDQTGYKWESTPYGERWVQYYKGKARHIGGVDLFSAPRQISNFTKSLDIRDRVEDEGKKENPRNIDDYIDSFIAQLLDGAQNKEEELEYLEFKNIHDASKQKKLIFAETGKEATSLIPDDALSWARRGAVSTAGEAVDNEITESAGVQEDKKIQSGVIETEEDKVEQPPMMSIADLKQWELDTRDTTPAGKAFGESGAQQRMDIRKNYLKSRGTIFDDNVRD